MPAPSDLSCRAARWLGAAALAAFLALGIPQASRPFHGDEVEFVRLGVALFERGSHQIDRGFIDDVTETGQFQTWNFHPPLYSWCLGAACRIFGPSETTARGFGLACGVVSLLLVFTIARRVSGGRPMGNLLAALAMLLCAVNPFFLQACLRIDIDGTLYTTLFLLLVALALRLESAGEARRLPTLAVVFATALATKMTTVLVFPIVLAAYHAVRGEGRRALGDALVIGVGGTGLFLAAYASYAAAMDMTFAEVFTHTSRSSTGFGALNLLLRLLAFSLPLPLLWEVLHRQRGEPHVPRLALLAIVAGALGLLYAVNVLRPILGLWITWHHTLTSFYLITVPFCMPALLVIFYATLPACADRWLRRRFEPLDLVVGLTVAVIVTYIGVMTRGAVFSLYQAPVIPLLAVVAAVGLGGAGAGARLTRRAVLAFAGVLALASVYGLVALGDAYFLVKYRLLDVPNAELFGTIVRWWAALHGSEPATLRTLTRHLGYQPAGLAAIWYALALLPLLIAGLGLRRWLPPAASLGATTLGLSLALSGCQSAATYSTSLPYGLDFTAEREMAAFINSRVRITGHFLASRSLGFYIKQPGFIDDTRYTGGYQHTTIPEINANGELILRVEGATARADALPRTPIHAAVGRYPLLDRNPAYRVVKQIGSLKLYAYVGPRPAGAQVPP